MVSKKIPMVVFLSVAIILFAAGCVARVAAEETTTEWNYCSQGMSQVPEWSMGICGDADLIDMVACQPPGELENTGPDPREASIFISSAFGRYHCLKDPVFWPLTEGITTTFPITMDIVVELEFPPESRWGLGSDEVYCHSPNEQFLPLVLR